jgi:5-methylcytosine-specific restriction endonuclease McrA
MARIPQRLRQQVIDRAHGRCEYCQTQQAIVVSMEIDHLIPEAVGGDTTLDNLY